MFYLDGLNQKRYAPSIRYEPPYYNPGNVALPPTGFGFSPNSGFGFGIGNIALPPNFYDYLNELIKFKLDNLRRKAQLAKMHNSYSGSGDVERSVGSSGGNMVNPVNYRSAGGYGSSVGAGSRDGSSGGVRRSSGDSSRGKSSDDSIKRKELAMREQANRDYYNLKMKELELREKEIANRNNPYAKGPEGVPLRQIYDMFRGTTTSDSRTATGVIHSGKAIQDPTNQIDIFAPPESYGNIGLKDLGFDSGFTPAEALPEDLSPVSDVEEEDYEEYEDEE